MGGGRVKYDTGDSVNRLIGLKVEPMDTLPVVSISGAFYHLKITVSSCQTF
jgi:hypothetical protein